MLLPSSVNQPRGSIFDKDLKKPLLEAWSVCYKHGTVAGANARKTYRDRR